MYLLLFLCIFLDTTRIFSFTVKSSNFRWNRIFKPVVFDSQTSTPPTVGEAVVSAKKEYSFVQDELKPYAMKLHTRDQAKDGQQKAQTPFTKWEPTRANYLQFLQDSLKIYQTFDEINGKYDVLAPFRQTGLERQQALEEDIHWLLDYDKTLTRPTFSAYALDYAQVLQKMAQESIPKYICHYYNHYFAHTAGGRMIGAKMAEILLEKKVLKFYQWEGDVKVLIDATKLKIDQLASTWTEEEKKDCMEQTMNTFQYGGLLLSPLRPPSPAPSS
jgi:heme oxygenase (biliverdin-producing, ferredoxin)